MSLQTVVQYQNTLKWIKHFEDDIAKAISDGPPADVHLHVWQAGIDAMKSQLNDLMAEKEDFEKRMEITSHETLMDLQCLLTGKCQETEGFKGTPHEGVDVCEDGCVWYNPRKK